MSVPAALTKAGEKDDVKFDSALEIVDGDGDKTYERVKQTRSGAGSGRKAKSVDDEDGPRIVKGLWVGDDQFNPLPDGALEKIGDETEITDIEIEEFVKLADVQTERFEGAYYLLPQKGGLGAKPMKALLAALKAEKAAGMCKLQLKGAGGRQRLGCIRESNGRLIVNLMAFASDFREADESAQVLDDVVLDRNIVKLARELISKQTVAGPGRLQSEAVDEAVAQREKLYSKVLDGAEYVPPKPKQKTQPPSDVMAALEASLEAIS